MSVSDGISVDVSVGTMDSVSVSVAVGEIVTSLVSVAFADSVVVTYNAVAVASRLAISGSCGPAAVGVSVDVGRSVGVSLWVG